MATPEQPSDTSPTTPSSTGGYGFTPVAGARMPIPGNAEFLLLFVMWVVMFIFWLASDNFGTSLFMTLTAIMTTGYLISRGIAKASRVLEQ